MDDDVDGNNDDLRNIHQLHQQTDSGHMKCFNYVLANVGLILTCVTSFNKRIYVIAMCYLFLLAIRNS